MRSPKSTHFASALFVQNIPQGSLLLNFKQLSGLLPASKMICCVSDFRTSPHLLPFISMLLTCCDLPGSSECSGQVESAITIPVIVPCGSPTYTIFPGPHSSAVSHLLPELAEKKHEGEQSVCTEETKTASRTVPGCADAVSRWLQ